MSGLGPQTVKLLTSISVAAVAGLSVYFFLVKGSSSVGKLEISTDTTSSKKKLAYEEEIDNCVYCDYNATTPIYKEVFESMTPYFTKGFGNPSSSHVYGLCAKEAVARARHEVSEAINCKPSEVYFVSCGTEADNRAVDIAIHAFKSQKNNSDSTIPVVITSSIEHVAVLCPLRHLHSLHKKIILKVIPVDSEGFVSLTDLEKELTPNVALVSIMHSNNEVGTIQPIRAISRIIKKFNKAENTNILFHTDAAQSFGKVPIDVEGLGVDMATLVGHKFGAPKGVGALFLREGIKASPMLVGGSQENGLRGGTENVPYIVGFGEASRLAAKNCHENLLQLISLKLRLLQKLSEFLGTNMKYVKYNGPLRSNHLQYLVDDIKMLKILLKPQNRKEKSSNNMSANNLVDQLPNTISISFKNLVGHDLVNLLGKKVACSAGSACHSVENAHENQVIRQSDVLVAMRVAEEYGIGTLRLSLGKYSTQEQVDFVAKTVAETVLSEWRKAGFEL